MFKPLSSSRSIAGAIAVVVLTASALAQVTSPPVILKGTAPSGDVHSMPNSQNSLASTGDGSVVALIYRQTSATAGGHLTLAVSTGLGTVWNSFYPLPQNTGHRVHDRNSGVMCAGRACHVVHVGWADRSVGGTFTSAYHQGFDTTARKWIGKPTLLGAANATGKRHVVTTDIAVTPRGTVAVAIGVGANGGLGMGAWECGLRVREKGKTAFSKLHPVRNGGMPWSRDAAIVAVDEVIHCCFKNQKGSGGIAYRSFDTVTMKWQQSAQVMVGPNDNGIGGVSGINAGNKSMIAKDTRDNLYILYVTGSDGGLKNNNKMRMAYTTAGKGSLNTDWADLEILSHTTTLGKNPRGVAKNDPAYPLLQGGLTDYYNYTLAPGFQGSMIVVYSKPWEDFQNKYIQIWQYGLNVPIGGSKEINFWADKEPYMFERLVGMRNTSSVGQGAWLVYGKNDKPKAGQAPNGQVRLWAVTYSTGRTISFGTGCRGTLAQVPRMHANEQFASLGNPYYVNFDRFPLLANFFLALGMKCQTLDLGAIGAPGCELNIEFPVIAPLRVGVNGQLKLTWNVPNQNNLIGAFFYSQSFVLNSRANPAGAITSNALRTTISL